MKAAIVLFADTDRPEGMGRMANAVTSAREFLEAGDEVVLILDGAGVRWIPELADAGHKSVRSLIADGHQVITF